jgi:hypothetical protein
MTPNKRDLKAFVRYDGSGRVVAGSLILRRKKPKVGKWKEIEGYECCNPLVNIVSETAREITPSMSFQLRCGETVLAFQEFTGMTDWDDFIANLELYIPGFGTYTYTLDEGFALVTLTMTSELAEALCPGGTMTITISEA